MLQEVLLPKVTFATFGALKGFLPGVFSARRSTAGVGRRQASRLSLTQCPQCPHVPRPCCEHGKEGSPEAALAHHPGRSDPAVEPRNVFLCGDCRERAGAGPHTARCQGQPHRPRGRPAGWHLSEGRNNPWLPAPWRNHSVCLELLYGGSTFNSIHLHHYPPARPCSPLAAVRACHLVVCSTPAPFSSHRGLEEGQTPSPLCSQPSSASLLILRKGLGPRRVQVAPSPPRPPLCLSSWPTALPSLPLRFLASSEAAQISFKIAT